MINFLLPEVNDKNLTEGGGERDHLRFHTNLRGCILEVNFEGIVW